MSTIEDVSDTALWVASFRAKESERADACFRDPLASILVGDRGRQIAKSMPYGKIMAWVMVARTTAIDRLVEDALKKSVDTVVNLGAGLDTRPYRMKLPAELRWIEVDFPKMIDLKNKKLQNERPVCRLERIGLDLSNRSLRQELFARIGNESKRVLLITEGVIPYLSNDDAGLLATDLASVPNFQLWIQDFYLEDVSRRTPRKWRKHLKAAPFLFNPHGWFDFFGRYGWKPDEKILLVDEARRLGRPVPFIFPYSLLRYFLSRARKQKIREGRGYVLMKR